MSNEEKKLEIIKKVTNTSERQVLEDILSILNSNQNPYTSSNLDKHTDRIMKKNDELFERLA